MTCTSRVPLTYTLLVLAAGLLARGRSTGREGLIRFAVAAGIMIAPQFGNNTHLVLSQPDHLGTALPLLLVFLMLDRAPRRWYVPVAVGAVLTWVVIADRVALLTAAVPLAVVCAARVLFALLRHRKPLASQWYELSLIAASVLSFAVAELAVRLISVLHGYQVTPVASAKLAPAHHLPHAIKVAVQGIVNMYGADFVHLSNRRSVRTPAGGPAGGRRGRPGRGALGRPGAGGVGLLPRVPVLLRPRRPGFPGAGHGDRRQRRRLRAQHHFRRDMGRQGDRGRAAVRRCPGGAHGAATAGQAAAAGQAGTGVRAAVGVLACYLAGLGFGAAQSPQADNEQAVIPWLEAHHLTSGLGTYVEANLITMDSGGRVAIREVAWRSFGDTQRSFESKASWYDPRQSYANFVLTNSAEHWGMDGGFGRQIGQIPRSAIAALHAGPPAHVYHYKTFTIMVWNHNLLENLGKTPFVQPGQVPCTRDCV